MPKGITHVTPPNRCRLQIARNHPRRFRSRGTLVQLSCAVLPHGRMSTSLSTGNGGYYTTFPLKYTSRHTFIRMTAEMCDSSDAEGYSLKKSSSVTSDWMSFHAALCFSPLTVTIVR